MRGGQGERVGARGEGERIGGVEGLKGKGRQVRGLVREQVGVRRSAACSPTPLTGGCEGARGEVWRRGGDWVGGARVGVRRSAACSTVNLTGGCEGWRGKGGGGEGAEGGRG